jgi:signal transduction histidine kinase
MTMRDALRSLLAEPRVPNPPVRVWRDWALVAVLVPVAILEGTLRENVVWRPVALAIGVGMIFTLLWRRTHPLAVVTVVFGALTALNIAAVIAGVPDVGLYTTVFILLLPYSLLRWASGAEAAIGLAIIVVTAIGGGFAAATGDSSGNVLLESFIGSLLFLEFPAALGASVRYRENSRLREIDQVKFREREQLARELHDTVAHHVSAIAVQAQAGRAIAASDPDGAVARLAVIEEEASRTLAEMRLMVSSLRSDEEPDLVPQRGVADIESLARGAGRSLQIDVKLSGDLDDLRPSVETAIYRLAQESITNAVRHARRATRVEVSVTTDGNNVRLTVADDGDATDVARNPSGYGLMGMTERATLVGGTLTAGPSPNRGWTVSAVLPKGGAGQ